VKQARFRFYAELNDFLPLHRQHQDFMHSFQGRPAVKDVIESLGVPHTEVDLILVDGSSVGFDHILRGGERVSVYPVFESIDISPVLRVRPEPLREVCFVLDIHLGRLAGYLRLVGFDARYRNDYEDLELAQVSCAEGRILLTKDRGLLKRTQVTHGYYVRSSHPREQLLEVLRRFDLFASIEAFSRCLRCNDRIKPVRKEEVLELLPQQTRKHFDDFYQCVGCGRVYWKGSHYDRMLRFVTGILEAERASATDEKDR
jgi:uncharacterized protein with PIN domain